MLDYTLLKLIWWGIIGCIFILYSTTAGFDYGVTLIMPFLRSEDNRRLALAASMPTWDGNLTWIVFAGGALFVVWPVVYATAFSGLYFAFFVVLWTMYFRPPGFDYRDRIDNPIWRRCWDFGLFISSLVPVAVFGIGMGNCFLGFPFHFDPFTMRDTYTGSFSDLFTGFTVLCAVVSLCMIVMHGSAYLQRRVEGALQNTARKLHLIFALLTFVFFTIALILVSMKMPGYHLISSPPHPTVTPLDNVVKFEPLGWANSFADNSWKIYPLMLTYAAFIITLWSSFLRAYATCFWSSACFIGGMICAAGSTLFPFIMASSTYPNQSLTVFNATSSEYSLRIMLYVGVVLFVVILCYKIFAYYTVWHKKPSISLADLDSPAVGTY